MRRVLFKVLLTAFGLTAAAANVFAQDSTSISANRLNWNGRWAMQFAVTDLQLTSFNGATLSLRKHLGLRPAVRLGLGVHDISREEFQAPGSSSPTAEFNTLSMSLSLEYMHYLNLASPVNAFFSLGPGGGYLWRNTDSGAGWIEDRNWNVSLGLGLGVEWFVHRQISISGEYRSMFFYEDRTRTSQSSSGLGNTSSATNYGFGSSGVRAGIAILI